MKYTKILSLAALSTLGVAQAQNAPYWQQHVDYKMDIDMNVKNYQYTGKQELTYTNNSPDTLKVVFGMDVLGRRLPPGGLAGLRADATERLWKASRGVAKEAFR